MILVAGGTGRLGQLVVRRLTESGHPVRVLTRDPARAGQFAGIPVEIVEGDVRDATTLPRALEGVDVVVSAVHGFAGPGGVTPRSVDRDGNRNFIRAAKDAGARFILVSVVGASPDNPMELCRMKHAAEQTLQASGCPWTIIRATSFLELWIEMLQSTAAKSGRPLIFGKGENPINFVSVEDVARAVEWACIEPSALGRILEIGGPENLTFNQLAALVQAPGTNQAQPRHIPRPMLRIMAATVGRLKPMLGGQMRASLVMDTQPMTFDAASHTFPPFAPTHAAVVIERAGVHVADSRSPSAVS